MTEFAAGPGSDMHLRKHLTDTRDDLARNPQPVSLNPEVHVHKGHEIESAERVTLRDGIEVSIRRIRPADWVELVAFVTRLSPQSRRMRFFTPKKRISMPFAKHLSDVDFCDRAAFVVCFPGESIIRGVGRYEREGAGSTSAEVAFVVEDSLHGLGIATHLLVHLRLLAAENGITTFTATVLGENDDMISVFRNSGLPTSFVHERDLVRVSMDLAAPGTD